MALLGFLGKDKKESLNKGLEKTKESVFLKLSRAIVGKSKVDEEVLDNLEEVLVSSDVGVETTLKIIKRPIIIFWRPRRILLAPLRYINHHPLPSPR